MRLFAAIEVPDEIKQSIATMSCDLSGARWVKAPAIHLTLRFIGELDGARIEELKMRLGDVRGSTFELRFRGAGTFGGSSRRNPPRVLWLDFEPAPTLTRIKAQIDAALERVEVPPEDRPYRPHLTLARLKNSDPEQVRDYVDRVDITRLPPITVDHFTLFSSDLKPDGPIHTAEARFLLERRS